MLLRARRVVFGILPLCATFILISFPPSALRAAGYVEEKTTIVGVGLQVLSYALFVALDNPRARITIYEKNSAIRETVAAVIASSLTADEMLLVIPAVGELPHSLQTPFDYPGGIRVPDVAGIDESVSTRQFVSAVKRQGQDLEQIQAQ